MLVFLLCWLFVPLLLGLLSLGCGLLVAEAASRMGSPRSAPLPALLVVPLGFALLVVVASLLTYWKATTVLAGVAPVLLALAGVVVGRGRLRGWWVGRGSALWPALAAAMPMASVAAPVVLTGQAGMSGYTKITDLGHQIAFIEYLRTDGREAIAATTSSFDEVVVKLIGGYPGGTQSVVASMGDLARVDVAWAYQPVLAFVAAMLGLALYTVLRRSIRSAPWRALAAGIAAQPTILYAYTLAGGIKELSGAAAIVLLAAVLGERRPLSWSVIVPAAVAIASAYAIFSVTILPWVGVIFLVVATVELVRERQVVSTAARWAAIWAGAALLAGPAVTDGIELYEASGTAGPEGLGNLAAALPAWSAVGPWLTLDHRFPLDQYGRPGLTYLLIGVAVALAIIGFVRVVRTRDVGMLALSLGGAVATAYIMRNSGVWVQLKAYCMTAPITLALAFAGAAWVAQGLRGSLRRPAQALALGAAGLVAVGVLYGNALQYHHTPLMTYDRMNELSQINERFAGQGPALAPDFDEFAEYFLRDMRASGLVDPWHGEMLYNRTARPGLQTVRDTDEYDQRFLQRWPLLIRRRDPTASRPPGNFRRVEVTRDYEIWRRVGDPRTVAAHYPLDGAATERTVRFCRRVADSLDRAGSGARVRYPVPPSAVTAVVPAAENVPALWGRNGDVMLAGAPGTWRQSFSVPVAGAYHVSMEASIGRRVTVAIDGREVGSLRWRESYPGHFESIGTVRLPAGRHTLAVTRARGNVLPGTGNDAAGTTTAIGPLVLEPTAQRTVMRTIPGSQLGSACRSDVPMDWIEVLGGPR